MGKESRATTLAMREKGKPRREGENSCAKTGEETEYVASGFEQECFATREICHATLSNAAQPRETRERRGEVFDRSAKVTSCCQVRDSGEKWTARKRGDEP